MVIDLKIINVDRFKNHLWCEGHMPVLPLNGALGPPHRPEEDFTIVSKILIPIVFTKI